jgi:adenylylsulfate kinase-like enzyme
MNITISGVSGEGKSIIAKYVSKCLTNCGIEVHNYDDDCTVSELNSLLSEKQMNELVKNKPVVNIYHKQLRRQ